MKKKKTIDTQILDRAICFATKAHEGVARKGTDIPYIAHPLEAMTIVASITSDQELMAAALLHDVVEDAGITVEEIRQEFGSRIADLVDGESDREVPGLTHAESWQHRTQATIDWLPPDATHRSWPSATSCRTCGPCSVTNVNRVTACGSASTRKTPPATLGTTASWQQASPR